MTDKDNLTSLLRSLDAPAASYHRLDQYYAGEQPLSFLSPESRKSLGNRLSQVSVNVPRLLVDSVTERLRVTGFEDAGVWPLWLSSDLDQKAPLAHREALVLGKSYVLLWGADGRYPSVTVESARSMTVQTDPATGEVLAAIKRYETDKTTECVVLYRDRVQRWSAPRANATEAGGFHVAKEWPNPLGFVPVVAFENRSRLLGDPVSEMRDVLSLTDAVVKLTADMMVASEFTARPRRTATGIELVEVDATDDDGEPTGEVETVSPFSEDDRMLVAEPAEARFGQLPGSDLAGYQNAIGVVMRQISAVSGLPPHLLGVGGDANPTSADAIRASEAALTARAEGKQQGFGRSWERVAAMMQAMTTGADLAEAPRVKWADAGTRSTAQEADAVVKLFTAGLISRSAALARMGYSEDEITRIRADVRAEALDTAGTSVEALL